MLVIEFPGVAGESEFQEMVSESLHPNIQEFRIDVRISKFDLVSPLNSSSLKIEYQRFLGRWMTGRLHGKHFEGASFSQTSKSKSFRFTSRRKCVILQIEIAWGNQAILLLNSISKGGLSPHGIHLFNCTR